MLRLVCLWGMAFLLQNNATQAMTKKPQPKGKPNIILILADDQTWRDSGVYGNPDVHTPNINRLASQGMRFESAFTSTAMCAPTRQQLYTGLFPVHSGAYPNGSMVKEGTRSIAHYLRGEGYRVAIAGKRHIGPRSSFPFDVVGDKREGHLNLVDLAAVEEFVAREDQQPFLLIVASNNPHYPWTRGDSAQYDPDKLSVPEYLVDTIETRKAMAQYYAEVTDLDRQVGAVDLILTKYDKVNNTIFIYTSEHGSMFPRAKWTLYDLGIKTALIIRWPGVVTAGSITNAMVQYVDVVPTLLDAVGGTLPDVDGTSFLAVLKGAAEKHNEYVYGVHTTRGICNGNDYPIRSVRSSRYKLILNLNAEEEFRNNLVVYDKGGFYESWKRKGEAGDQDSLTKYKSYKERPRTELYDVITDPFELKNLADDHRYELVTARLEKKLTEWLATQGDEGMGTEQVALERLSEAAIKKISRPVCRQ